MNRYIYLITCLFLSAARPGRSSTIRVRVRRQRPALGRHQAPEGGTRRRRGQGTVLAGGARRQRAHRQLLRRLGFRFPRGGDQQPRRRRCSQDCGQTIVVKRCGFCLYISENIYNAIPLDAHKLQETEKKKQKNIHTHTRSITSPTLSCPPLYPPKTI